MKTLLREKMMHDIFSLLEAALFAVLFVSLVLLVVFLVMNFRYDNEGDILKSNKYASCVFYERGAYCVKFRRTQNTMVTMTVISFIEKYKTKIIGNVYENPELLEDTRSKRSK